MLPAPVWTLALLDAMGAATLGLGAVAPFSKDTPVDLAQGCAALLGFCALLVIAVGPRLGDWFLFGAAVMRIAVAAAMAGFAVTEGGIALLCVGFVAIAGWVALFFPARALAPILAIEVLGALMAVAINADPVRAAATVGVMLVGSVITSGLIAHVIGGLRRQALRDQLTGLLNRHGIDHTLSDLDRRRRSVAMTSLIAIDIDGFKQVNDRRGHLEGDRLLASFARRLTLAIGADGVAGRIGGDEFIAILPGRSAEEAAGWATCLRDDCDVPWSFGVAERYDGEMLDSWLERADQLMYAAKARRSSRVVAHVPEPSASLYASSCVD